MYALGFRRLSAAIKPTDLNLLRERMNTIDRTLHWHAFERAKEDYQKQREIDVRACTDCVKKRDGSPLKFCPEHVDV